MRPCTLKLQVKQRDDRPSHEISVQYGTLIVTDGIGALGIDIAIIDFIVAVAIVAVAAIVGVVAIVAIVDPVIDSEGDRALKRRSP